MKTFMQLINLELLILITFSAMFVVTYIGLVALYLSIRPWKLEGARDAVIVVTLEKLLLNEPNVGAVVMAAFATVTSIVITFLVSSKAGPNPSIMMLALPSVLMVNGVLNIISRKIIQRVVAKDKSSKEA